MALDQTPEKASNRSIIIGNKDSDCHGLGGVRVRTPCSRSQGESSAC